MSRKINIQFDSFGCLIIAIVIFFIILAGGIKIVIHTKGNSESEVNGLQKSRSETQSVVILPNNILYGWGV